MVIINKKELVEKLSNSEIPDDAQVIIRDLTGDKFISAVIEDKGKKRIILSPSW